jgi:hypothetical protein
MANNPIPEQIPILPSENSSKKVLRMGKPEYVI